MTEQTMRERIADEVHAYGTAAANYHESGRGLDSVDAIATTDRIIAIVREALLTDEVAIAVGDMSWTRMGAEDVMDFDQHVGIQRQSLQSALDAAFGEEVRDAD